MAESKDKKGQEDYQYSGEEFGIADEPAPQEFQAPSSGPTLPGILGRKFVVPGLVVIATLILYLWMSLSSKPTEEPKDISDPGVMKVKLSQNAPESAPAAPAVQQVAEVPKEPVKVEEPEPVVAVAPPTEPPVEPAKITELNASISQLQTTVTDISKDLVSINTKLDEVEKLAQKSIEEKQVIKPMVSKVQRSTVTKPKILPMIYEVKAVVPGRAWIQSDNGILTSIELGETLVGYGKVESIDVVQGVVKLSSGAEIHYGLYDR